MKRPYSVTDEQIGILVSSLDFGQEKAITRESLGYLLKVKDRELRHVVRAARLKGHRIGSSVKAFGYYLIDDPAELAETISQLRNYAASITRVADALFWGPQ